MNENEAFATVEQLEKAVERVLSELGINLVEVTWKRKTPMFPGLVLELAMEASPEAIETEQERSTREIKDAFESLIAEQDFSDTEIETEKQEEHEKALKDEVEGSMKSLKELLEGKKEEDNGNS